MRRNVLFHTIYTGGTFLICLIVFLLSAFIKPLQTFTGNAFFFGLILPLLTCFSWSRIIEEYNFRAEKFFKVLFWIGGIIGLLGLLLTTLIGFGTWIHTPSGQPSSIDPSGACFLWLSLGIWLALLINAILRNFPSLFPSTRDTWPRLFFEDYGFMILLPFTVATVSILANVLSNNSFYFTILLVWNLVVIFFFVFLKCRVRKVALGYIVIIITALLDACLGIFLFTSNEIFPEPALFIDPDFTYCAACCLFFLLALVICGPFYFVIEKIDRKVSRNTQSIIFFVVPLLSFGLQFVIFEYWWVALIAVAILIGISFIIALFTPSSSSYVDYVYEDDDGDYYVIRRYY